MINNNNNHTNNSSSRLIDGSREEGLFEVAAMNNNPKENESGSLARFRKLLSNRLQMPQFCNSDLYNNFRATPLLGSPGSHSTTGVTTPNRSCFLTSTKHSIKSIGTTNQTSNNNQNSSYCTGSSSTGKKQQPYLLQSTPRSGLAAATGIAAAVAPPWLVSPVSLNRNMITAKCGGISPTKVMSETQGTQSTGGLNSSSGMGIPIGAITATTTASTKQSSVQGEAKKFIFPPVGNSSTTTSSSRKQLQHLPITTTNSANRSSSQQQQTQIPLNESGVKVEDWNMMNSMDFLLNSSEERGNIRVVLKEQGSKTKLDLIHNGKQFSSERRIQLFNPASSSSSSRGMDFATFSKKEQQSGSLFPHGNEGGFNEKKGWSVQLKETRDMTNKQLFDGHLKQLAQLSKQQSVVGSPLKADSALSFLQHQSSHQISKKQHVKFMPGLPNVAQSLLSKTQSNSEIQIANQSMQAEWQQQQQQLPIRNNRKLNQLVSLFKFNGVSNSNTNQQVQHDSQRSSFSNASQQVLLGNAVSKYHKQNSDKEKQRLMKFGNSSSLSESEFNNEGIPSVVQSQVTIAGAAVQPACGPQIPPPIQFIVGATTGVMTAQSSAATSLMGTPRSKIGSSLWRATRDRVMHGNSTKRARGRSSIKQSLSCEGDSEEVIEETRARKNMELEREIQSISNCIRELKSLYNSEIHLYNIVKRMPGFNPVAACIVFEDENPARQKRSRSGSNSPMPVFDKLHGNGSFGRQEQLANKQRQMVFKTSQEQHQQLLSGVAATGDQTKKFRTKISLASVKPALIEYLQSNQLLVKPFVGSPRSYSQQQHFQKEFDSVGGDEDVFDLISIANLTEVLCKVTYFERSLLSMLQQKRADHLKLSLDMLKSEISQISNKTQQQIRSFQQKVPPKQADAEALEQIGENIAHILDRRNYMKQETFIEKFEKVEDHLGVFKKVSESSREQSKGLNQLSDVLRDFHKYA